MQRLYGSYSNVLIIFYYIKKTRIKRESSLIGSIRTIMKIIIRRKSVDLLDCEGSSPSAPNVFIYEYIIYEFIIYFIKLYIKKEYYLKIHKRLELIILICFFPLNKIFLLE